MFEFCINQGDATQLITQEIAISIVSMKNFKNVWLVYVIKCPRLWHESQWSFNTGELQLDQ